MTVFLAAAVPAEPAPAQDAVYLSDAYEALAPTCAQGWGALGLNTAAGQSPGTGAPLRIGEALFDKGLGHHAPGEIHIELPEGEYTAFAATVGVHWQGGGRGSVAFQVFVDGEKRFDSGAMTDSDAAQSVDVPLAGARQLRLVATDAGDGISCDMANWADARLLRDPNAMRFGAPEILLCGRPAPEPSPAVCEFSLIATDSSPQIAALGRGAFAACLREGEDVAV
ncbi:MAG: NPCBM/NEW2 domain-containing protein, partial [Candidatus Hydrogenedentes bacterium]|nr:NPCBM/NEW2 domain-containing protein [Candidatus Hydrogenedentota bacterium]